MSGTSSAARGPVHRLLMLALLLLLAGGLLQSGTTLGGTCAPGACASEACGHAGPQACPDACPDGCPEGPDADHGVPPGGHDCPGICCVGLIARPEVVFFMPAPDPGRTLPTETAAMPGSISTEPSVRPPNRRA